MDAALIGAFLELVTAATSVVIAILFLWISRQLLRRDEKKLVAQLERDYNVARRHVRTLRGVSEKLSKELASSPASPNVHQALARQIWAFKTGNKSPFQSELTQTDVEAVATAMDELNCFWDSVVYMAKSRLLPSNFFQSNSEWAKRAVKYLASVEPLDVANWYILKLHTVAKVDSKDESKGGSYSYMQDGHFCFRPERYNAMEKLLQYSNHCAGIDAWFKEQNPDYGRG